MTDTLNEITSDMSKRKLGRRGNGQGGLKLRGNTWYCRFTDALGNRQEISSHTANREEALKILATYTSPIRESKSQDEIKLRLQQSIDVLELRKDVSKIEKLKLENLIEKFLNHRNLVDIANSTKNIYKFQLNKLLQSISKTSSGVKYIDDVTIEVADNAMRELTKQLTPAAYNLALATYRRAWGMFSRNNPFMKINKRKIDKSRHRQVITENDIRRIFEACRDDVERAVWGVGVYTGLRCGDICNLTYGAISNDLSTITWMPQKTKRHMSQPLIIPICHTLKGLLLKVLDWRKIGNDEYKDYPLWEEYKNRYTTSNATRWFGRTLVKAGLQTSHRDKDGRVTVDTGFHITRLAFVTFASKYMSPLLVSKLVGHSAISMTEHYCQNNQDTIREGLSQMPNFTDDGETRKEATEEAEIMDTIKSICRDGERPIECLRRIIRDSIKLVG